MRGITPFRLPALVFGVGIAAALTFGASSAMATPPDVTANRYFCGYIDSLDGCQQCCGNYQESWDGLECWCGPDTKW
jgi:hypothetical protein